MSMKHYAVLLAGVALLGCQSTSSAQNVPALAGEVRSAEEGAMAGVTVTASREKSTISMTVITDDQDRYSFPAGHLGPGQYSLTIRAIGYDLDGKAFANVAAQATGATASADLKLKKTRNLAAQQGKRRQGNAQSGARP